ncbi:MAG: alpha/beta hydrolase-fold protein [Gammaproteobacteria bacterium]|nr:alpha/beta hydrolase-fold protein [Gammaproteobacteria bacterium]MDH3465201.1 alpha/beta hydrolase-fold protein [Gammaproteobacteria bacterium]
MPDYLLWALLLPVFIVLFGIEYSYADELATGGLQKRKTEISGLLGQRRIYRYFLPSHYDSDKIYPVVIALHGGVSHGRNIRHRSNLDQIAEREGFIAVYPEGNGLGPFLKHWNAGTCCAQAMKAGVDDVGFILHIIDELSASLSVDRTRIYVFGFSNGAMLAYQIAAIKPQRIAAIAAVSGTFGRVNETGEFDWSLPMPDLPVPTMIVHGADDPRLPFGGIKNLKDKRNGLGMIPVLEGAKFWARSNGCVALGKQISSGFKNVNLTLWPHCKSRSEVRLYRLDGWKHSWAGASPKTGSDYNRVGRFETAEVIWEFFKRFRRSQPLQ